LQSDTLQIIQLDAGNVEPHHCTGFVSVYQEAFSGPPWYETHPTEHVQKNVWNEHLPYCIILAVSGDEVIGIGCAHPTLAEMGTNGGVKEFLEANRELVPFPLETTLYMSELAVLEPYREKGIGQELTKARWHWGRTNGMTHYAMRTAESGSLSKLLYEKLGAQVVESLVQDVSDATIQSASDRRIYMWGKL